MEDKITNLPNLKINVRPTVRLKSLHLKGFKAFEDYTLNFFDESGIKEFICLIGPNGTGKSTILNAIQLLFAKIDGREVEQIRKNWGKAVRHVGKEAGGGTFGSDDFLVEGQMESSLGNYVVQVNKSGFIKEHPPEIKSLVYRLCYYAQFDKELQKFQLAREKWPTFKLLFETVTGFIIEEDTEIEKYYKDTSDPYLRGLIANYVLSFHIKKPHEIIQQREASDGERKIIKSFSTLLTLDYKPQIILVDNIEMHVEKKRHIALINAMKSCFPESQIFSTTHSYYVSKLLGRSAGVEDMRLVHANKIIQEEPWRLRIIDEVEEAMVKLEVFLASKEMLAQGNKLLLDCVKPIKDLQQFKTTLKSFLQEVVSLFVNDVML